MLRHTTTIWPSLHPGVLALCLFAAAAGRCEDLETAWELALAADQRVIAQYHETEASRWQVEAARRSRRPQLSTRTGYHFLSDAPQWQFSVPGGFPPLTAPLMEDQFALSTTQLSLPLYTGGHIEASVHAASSEVVANELAEFQQMLNIKLEVVQAYTSVLRARHAVEVAEANVKSLCEHARIVREKLNEGLVARNDLLAAEVALADARQKAIQARNAQEIAQAHYNRLLGRDQTTAVRLEELHVQPAAFDLATLTRIALDSRPELARLAAQANALQCRAEMERSANRPHVYASGGFTYVENDALMREDYWNLSLGVEWTPWDGGVARSKGNAREQQATALMHRQQDVATRIELQVRRAWLDVQETQQRLEVTGKAISQAEENLRVARQRYAMGQGTNTEVLDAESLRTHTYSNYYNAVYDSVLAVYRLKYATATL